MSRFGENIRSIRKAKGTSLEIVSRDLGIDVAVLSKLERGIRIASRQQVEALAAYFEVNLDQVMTLWVADKLYQQVENESVGYDALKLAEATLSYAKTESLSVKEIKSKLLQVFQTDERILRAWLFGSFSRAENTQSSDVDLLIELDEESDFNFFDLAEIQFLSEKVIGRKVDIGIQGTERDYALENILRDRIIVYDRTDKT